MRIGFAARRCWLQGLRLSVKQGDAKLFFQTLDAAAHTRLREMKPLLKIVKSRGAGNRSIVLIPQDADPARKAELLAELDKA